MYREPKGWKSVPIIDKCPKIEVVERINIHRYGVHGDLNLAKIRTEMIF